MRELFRRVQYILNRRQREADLAEEMAFHASLSGQRAFGSGALAQDQARDVWIRTWLQDGIRDLRFAARLLVKERSFTAVAVLTILRCADIRHQSLHLTCTNSLHAAEFLAS